MTTTLYIGCDAIARCVLLCCVVVISSAANELLLLHIRFLDIPTIKFIYHSLRLAL